jgi:hypothetical protein
MVILSERIFQIFSQVSLIKEHTTITTTLYEISSYLKCGSGDNNAIDVDITISDENGDEIIRNKNSHFRCKYKTKK